jgi:hypothetical protein
MALLCHAGIRRMLPFLKSRSGWQSLNPQEANRRAMPRRKAAFRA